MEANQDSRDTGIGGANRRRRDFGQPPTPCRKGDLATSLLRTSFHRYVRLGEYSIEWGGGDAWYGDEFSRLE
jgi:hypothetical protein